MFTLDSCNAVTDLSGVSNRDKDDTSYTWNKAWGILHGTDGRFKGFSTHSRPCQGNKCVTDFKKQSLELLASCNTNVNIFGAENVSQTILLGQRLYVSYQEAKEAYQDASNKRKNAEQLLQNAMDDVEIGFGMQPRGRNSTLTRAATTSVVTPTAVAVPTAARTTDARNDITVTVATNTTASGTNTTTAAGSDTMAAGTNTTAASGTSTMATGRVRRNNRSPIPVPSFKDPINICSDTSNVINNCMSFINNLVQSNNQVANGHRATPLVSPAAWHLPTTQPQRLISSQTHTNNASATRTRTNNASATRRKRQRIRVLITQRDLAKYNGQDSRVEALQDQIDDLYEELNEQEGTTDEDAFIYGLDDSD